MYNKSIYATACFLVSLSFAGFSHAESTVDYSDARNLLIGNTVEGKLVKQDVNYIMYLHPSGKLVRIDSNDVSEKGEWQINKAGELCLNFDSVTCHAIKKRGDEGYDLYSQQDVLDLTIDKVILGNPGIMKP